MDCRDEIISVFINNLLYDVSSVVDLMVLRDLCNCDIRKPDHIVRCLAKNENHRKVEYQPSV